MNRNEIILLLQQNHQSFFDLIENLQQPEFNKKVSDKWTPAQQYVHILKSVAPVNMAFVLPRFILKWKFGKANRPSKTYDQLIEKYKTKLQAGGRATGQFNVEKDYDFEQREILFKKTRTVVTQLCKRINNYSEEALDYYILPHPLLGKLTLREMLYFTAYHVQHHQQLVTDILNNKS